MSRQDITQWLKTPSVVIFLIGAISAAGVVQYQCSENKKRIAEVAGAMYGDHDRLVIIGQKLEFAIERLSELRDLLKQHAGNDRLALRVNDNKSPLPDNVIKLARESGYAGAGDFVGVKVQSTKPMEAKN